jgi:Phage major tail protein 2.
MATIVNGTDLRFYFDGVAIGEATSCTLNLTRETRETLTKDNVASWTQFEAGRKSGTCDIEGLISYDTTNKKVSDIFTAFDSGTVVVMRFTDDTATHPYWESSVIFTSLTFAGTVEENSTYSATGTITGAVTQGTES